MRYSRQRNLILDIVRSTDTHPTAEWIYQEAKLAMPSIGIATVYRDLNKLADSGEIKRISSAGLVDRFDRDTSDHSHMRCEKCGALIDLKPVTPEAREELRKMIMMTFDITDDGVKLGETLLAGTCHDCRTRAKRRS